MSNRKVLIDSLKKLGSAKAPTQKKDMIIDPRGQWAHPGKNTRIPSNNITMDAVPYPVYADPNVGPSRMMYPEQEYNFPGADYVDEYPQMRSGGNKHNHVVVKPSKIQGADKGLFSNQGFRKDQLIGLAHKNGQPVGHIGKMHNHSDEPNMYSIKKGNQRYVYAKRDIQPGEELTTNYRLQPELEQPEDFMRKGGSAPKLPKKKNSKGYSRSLEATNKFFAEHAFFAKPKSRKNKIYDPNAKYYQDGGELPEDYSEFESFAQTLPSNLQDPAFEYGNPDQYNLYGMWETVGKPGSFSDVQDGEYFPLQDDGSYHGFTVGSDGEFLKPMSHGTTWKEVMNAHLNTDPYFQQNRIIKNEQGRLQYIPREEKEYIEAELTPEEIERYAKGGYVIEDISIPSLTKAQGGGPITGIVKGGNTLSKIISGEGNVTNLLRLSNRAITPVGYGFAGKLMAAPLTFVAPYKPQTYNLKNRYDAWDIYNQMTPRYGGISANADGTAAIKDFEIARDVLDKIRKSKKTAFETVDFNDDLLAGNSVNFGGVHGNGHATKGVDEDGRDYIDFTDTWDLQPFQRRGFLPQAVRNFEAGTLTGGKPFELRNRIYFDEDGQYFDHDGNPLTEYEREMPNMKYSAAAKKVQSNAASGDIKDVETEWKMQKFLTTKNISQDEFNSMEDDWGSADNRAKLYQYGTLLGGLGLGAYGSYQYEQSTKPRLMFNTETGQYDLVTPAQIKTFPGRYIDTRPEQQYGGTLPKKQLGGLTKYAEFLPGITSFTPGNALRAAVYRGVNPASYNIKEKATGFPKEIFNTTFNNETRPFRVGMSLKYGTPDFMNTFFATKRITPQEYAKMPDSERMMLHDADTREILQDIGRRRLDAWAVGLKQPQEYGTLEQVGDNTYRMKDISYTPDFFSERYSDIQAQGVKDRPYSYGEESPLVTIARQHYDRTPHPFMQRGVSNNFVEQELLEKYQNAPRSYIDQLLGFPQYEPDPWTQQRHAGISTINQDPSFKYSVWDNDGYGVMGGYRWDVAKNPEGMHWQANDVWDINPWERRGSAYINQKDVFKKLLHANYFKPLQNVEVLGALGGKPFNIQNNFLIDPVTFKPLKQWQKGGFLKRRKKQPEQMEPIEVLQPGQEAFPLPETPVRDQWYDPIVLKDMTQEELDAYNKAYEEEQARLKFEADKAAQPSYFDEAKNWVSNWHDSPMYNQMVLNSYNGQQKNADYLTKLRKKNIADLPPLNVLDAEAEDNNTNLPDSSGVAAWSKSDTGQIEVFPGGYNYGPSLFTHEILHSSDRPRELYKWDHPAYSAEGYPDWMLHNDPRFPNEDVWHDRTMPKSDQMYITGHRGSNWKDNEAYKLNKAQGWYTPRTDEEIKKDMIENGFDPNEPEFNNIFESIKKQDKQDAKDYSNTDKKYWKEFGHDYVSDPTEVRARLGEIRFHAQKEGIYDPFTEQITPEIFQNYINKERDSKNWQPLKPIDELRQEFTDEEILYMLQHISKNDSEEGSEFDEQTAKFGGAKRKLKRRQNGGPSPTVEEPPKGPGDPAASTDLTEAQQWITDWYKNRKIPVPENDPRYAKDMMKILPAYNPESPILINATNFPQYINDPTLGDLNPEGLNIGAAGTYEMGKEGSVIRLNPALTPTQRVDTEIHELTNHMMEPVKDKVYPMQNRIVEQNIIPFNEDWTEEQQNFYDYVIDPQEQNIQSYLNVARKNFGLQPDEVITPERIQQMKQQAEEKGLIDHNNPNFNPDIYMLFKMGKDEQGLSNLFNYIAKNDVNEDSMTYAQLGGAYELGDEVDETTMKKLKKLGYTFEKI